MLSMAPHTSTWRYIYAVGALMLYMFMPYAHDGYMDYDDPSFVADLHKWLARSSLARAADSPR